MTALALPDAVLLGRWERGEAVFTGAAARVRDVDLEGPSLLAGWTRGRVLAHVARNADALVNLLTWASTGVETPMYASPEARDTQIAQTVALPPDALREDLARATRRLADAVHTMPGGAWSAPVRTAQGRTVPAERVPWMRSREVYVHSVDLDAGPGFADVEADVLAALVDDVFATWAGRDDLPAVTVGSDGRRWGDGPLRVTGELPAVAAWVTGRSAGAGLLADGPLPGLPRWL